MKSLLPAVVLAGSALAATAQTAEPQFNLSCETNNGSRNNTLMQHCETRDLTLAAVSGRALAVNADPNGGITVHGWDGPNVRIRAKI